MTSSFIEIKVLFFIWQKISRRCPWKTEFICMRYFLKTECKSTGQCFLCQNKSVYKKISSILQKMKIGPENNICPFTWKPSIYVKLVLMVVTFILNNSRYSIVSLPLPVIWLNFVTFFCIIFERHYILKIRTCIEILAENSS